jgi:hypothetical protein
MAIEVILESIFVEIVDILLLILDSDDGVSYVRKGGNMNMTLQSIYLYFTDDHSAVQ